METTPMSPALIVPMPIGPIPSNKGDQGENVPNYPQVKKQVEEIHSSRTSPKETVLNIFLGKPYSLDQYKSFTDKIELVDEAIKLGDGNAILAAANFLKQTLTRSKVQEIFATR